MAMLVMIVSAVLHLVQPFLTKIAIDRYIAHHDVSGITLISITLLLVLVASFGLQFAQTLVTQLMGQRIMSDLRLKIYTRMQELGLSYYDQNPVGRVLTLVTHDVEALNDLFTSGVVSVSANVLLLSGCIVALVFINWRLALVAFSILPLVVLVTNWFRRNVRSSYRSVRVWVARINAYLQEDITGTVIVRLFRRETVNFSQFDEINRQHRNATVNSISYYAVFYPAIELLSALTAALILWFGGGWVMSKTLTLGSLVAFLQYSIQLYQPISDLSEKFDLLQAAMASSERIAELLDMPVPTSSSHSDVVNPAGGPGHIIFEDVSFAYVGCNLVLRNVSFEIRPGERVAIVGATGAGKSTVLNLLLRFYEVTRGRILIDNVDIRQLDVMELRTLFALVLQDQYIFAGSVAANLRLGNPYIDDERLRSAIQAVHADRFIDRLPRGLDTLIAERGSALSVGEKQLLSFARALAFDRRILVLDEATSNVDAETEAAIRDALRVSVAGRTTIAIAHRLSSIYDMDRILVLHRGELRESGTHAELLAHRGLYYQLHQVQYQRGSIEPALNGR